MTILAVVATFVTPCMQLVSRYLFVGAAPGTRWYHLLNILTPRLLKPVPSGHSDAFLRSYAKQSDGKQVVVSLWNYLTLLLTYGVVFPPLAVSFLAAICSVSLCYELKVGRFLTEAATAELSQLVEAVKHECQQAGSVEIVRSCVWIVVTFSCCFYTLFLFDTLGGAVGFDGAYWILVVMPLMPLMLYTVFQLVGRLYPSTSLPVSDVVAVGDVEMLEPDSSSNVGNDGGAMGSTVNALHQDNAM